MTTRWICSDHRKSAATLDKEKSNEHIDAWDGDDAILASSMTYKKATRPATDSNTQVASSWHI
jgi:hypothetical protein